MLEISVNNEQIDLDSDTFNLNQVVTDIENPDRIGASYTNTIKAPATDKNNRIFGYLSSVNTTTDTQNQTLFCQVKYFGQTLDIRPSLLLQNFDGKYYNFNLLFSISSFAQILSEKTLQNLNLGTVLYQISNMNFDNDTLDYINAYYLKGKNNIEAWYNMYYAWKVKRVLTQIIADAGYSIDGVLPDSMDWLDDKYILPTNEKLSFEAEFETDKQALEGLQRLSADASFVGGSAYIINFDTIEGNGAYFKNTHYAPLTGYVYSVKASLLFQKISTLSNFGFTIGYVTDPLNPATTFVPLHEQINTNITGGVGSTQLLSYSIAVAKETLPLNGLYVRLQGASLSNITVKAGSYFQVKVANYVPEGTTTFNHADSLPPVRQRDFLKSIIYASGCVLQVDNWAKTVKFVKIADILSNNNSINWTDKVDWGKGVSIEYTPSNVAQSNVIKFKDTSIGSVSFAVPNTNLETKKEFSLVFKSGENANTVPKLAITDIRDYANPEIVLPSEAPEDIRIDNVNMIRFFADSTKKKQDLTFGKLIDNDNLRFSIYHNPLNFPSNEYETEQVNEVRPTAYILPSGCKLMQGFDNLSAIAPNFGYSTKVFDKYMSIKLKIKLSVSDIVNLSNEFPIFIGGNTQRKFVLMEVNNWQTPYEVCDVELLRID